MLSSLKCKGLHQGCYSPSPLRKSRPEIREDTGPGLILGQDQGRHRVVKQTERKLCFIDYDLLTMLSLEYKTTVIVETTSTCWAWKSSLQVVLNARFHKLTFGEP